MAPLHLTVDERGVAPPDPADWYITIDWQEIDGRLVPVGIDVRSYRIVSWTLSDDGRLTFPPGGTSDARAVREGDHLRPVTRDLFKRLPVGELVQAGREQIAAVLDFAARTGVQLPPAQRWVAEALRNAPRRSSRSDVKYRRAAVIYAEVVSAGHRNPSERTWQRLGEEGFVAQGGGPLSRELVRKWVAEARRRGYLPPNTPSTECSAEAND